MTAAEYEAELIRVGDAMQSSLSRLAEFVSDQQADGVTIPYEVHMGRLEGEGQVDGWTRIRRQHGEVERPGTWDEAVTYGDQFSAVEG